MSNNKVGGKPDIYVAVDFGTTYTGVAWTKPHERKSFNPVYVIADWPGSASTIARKVPSVLAKQPNPDGIPNWGFLCEEDLDETNKWRFLKVLLDPAQHRLSRQNGVPWAPSTLSKVHELVTLYLRQVYLHIKKAITQKLGLKVEGGDWNSLSVLFTFSVPTTWEDQEVLNTFRQIIKNAGFGEPAKHEAVLGLTEAEAAAVAAICREGSSLAFENGDAILSIDAGGGTTDLGFVKVIDASPRAPIVEQMQAVKGTGAGSMLIDMSFRKLVLDRMSRCPERHPQLPRHLPSMLSQSRLFQLRKHYFGEANFDMDTYAIPIVGANHDFRDDDLGIEDGDLRLRREELQAFFDVEVKKILEILDAALDKFSNDGFSSLQYVILSGGLGSSAYVLDRIEKHILEARDNGNSVLRNTVVSQSDDPQLVVIKGVLHDQVHNILRTRIARASYGLVGSLRYSKKNGFNQEITRDIHDGKKYLDGQIRWFVKNGDKIPNGEPFLLSVNRRVSQTDDPLRWTETIVYSNSEGGWVPTKTTDPTVTELHKIHVDLTNVAQNSLASKSRHFLKRKKYYTCQYDISMAVGPSGDLRFEVQYEGQPVAGSAEPFRIPIKADWDAAPAGGNRRESGRDQLREGRV